MAEVDSIGTVAALWPASTLVTDVAESGGASPMSGYLILFTGILLVCFFLFLNHVFLSVKGSVEKLFFSGKTRIDATLFSKCSIITLLLCVPLTATVLAACGIGSSDIPRICVVLTLFLVLEWLASVSMAMLSDKEEVKEILPMSRGLFILAALLSVPAPVLSVALGGGWSKVACIYLSIIYSSAALLFLYFSAKTILGYKFSYVFSFLYLCGLELLPLAATVKILLC